MEILKKALFAAGVCLFMISFLHSMFTVVSMSGYDDTYSPEKSEVPLEGGGLAVFGCRDQVVEFHITGSSANGLWASSTGAILTFDYPDAPRITLFGPRVKGWEDVLESVSGFGRSLDIHTQFIVPTIAEPTLAGRITGSITIPIVEGNRSFWNRTLDLNIPVILAIISPQEAERLQRATRTRQWNELFGGLAVFLVSGIYLYFRAAENDGHRFRTWQIVLYCASGIGVSLLVALLVWLWIKASRLGISIPDLLRVI
jgi:hypothetical protein